MLNVVSLTGVSTVPPAGAEALVDGCVPLLAGGLPESRNPTAQTTTAATARMTTTMTAMSARPGPRRGGAWYPGPAYCDPAY